MRCPLCAGDATVFFRSRLGWSVRSDWTPIKRSVELLACAACGHVFKDEAPVRASSDYEAYRVWNNEADADKVDFESGAMVTRSAAFLAFLRTLGALTDSTRVLDFGCNRAALLALLPGAHAGYDVSDAYRSNVERLGHAYYTPASPPPVESFELVTLVHVLEHLVDLREDALPAVLALARSGAFAVQVPDVRTQPTDVYVADHRHHFSAGTLARALGVVGCPPIASPTSILPGELTAVGRPASHEEGPHVSPDVIAAPIAPIALARTLEDAEAKLEALSRGARPAIVYGAGLLGSLVASVLGARAEAFVDDNPKVHGTSLLDRPVLRAEDLRPQSLVVLAVPPSVAAGVGARCRAMGHDVITPFT